MKIVLSGIALLILMLAILAFLPVTHPNPASRLVMEFKNYNPSKSAEDASIHDLSAIAFYQGGDAIISACGSQSFFTYPMVDNETPAISDDLFIRDYIICATQPESLFVYPDQLDVELARYEDNGVETLGEFADSIAATDPVQI